VSLEESTIDVVVGDDGGAAAAHGLRPVALGDLRQGHVGHLGEALEHVVAALLVVDDLAIDHLRAEL